MSMTDTKTGAVQNGEAAVAEANTDTTTASAPARTRQTTKPDAAVDTAVEEVATTGQEDKPSNTDPAKLPFVKPYRAEGVSVFDAEARQVCIVASAHSTEEVRSATAVLIAEALNA
jgi:hypothetical protein